MERLVEDKLTIKNFAEAKRRLANGEKGFEKIGEGNIRFEIGSDWYVRFFRHDWKYYNSKNKNYCPVSGNIIKPEQNLCCNCTFCEGIYCVGGNSYPCNIQIQKSKFEGNKMTPFDEDERAIVEQLLLSALVKSSHNGESPEDIADSLACLARREDRDITRDMAITMTKVVDEELEKIKYLERELTAILKKIRKSI